MPKVFDVDLVVMWLTLPATSVCKKWPEGKKEFIINQRVKTMKLSIYH